VTPPISSKELANQRLAAVRAGVTVRRRFTLILRYSATRLSVFTFLTPLFGVAAGHIVLNEPLTAPLVVAVALVALGLALVNRPR
jgi:hypothetical protein